MYLIGIFFGQCRLLKSRGPLWLLIFLAASVLSLAPTPLLELRYLSPSVMVAMLNSPRVPDTALARGAVQALTVAFMTVNVIAGYVFVHRSFLWPDGSVARFMY
jgi:hypothetical protein